LQGGGQGFESPRLHVVSALKTKPVVTYVLIGINVLAFLWQLSVGIAVTATNHGLAPLAVANGDWSRLVTAVFLHGSFLHLAFNMYVLFVIGRQLEEMLGSARFIVLYSLSALGGVAASFAFSNPAIVSVGASGAIFGLMGGLLVAGKRLRYDVTQVLILIAINVGIGFVVPNIDWRAHLGGLLAGLAVGTVLTRPRGRVSAGTEVLGCLAIAAVCVLLIAQRSMQLA
jgi:membrane associated rhomboid family serine protease